MAKLGLGVRDDPKKVVDVSGRKWGEPVDGLTLSAQLREKEDPDQLPAISAAIRNRGAHDLRLTSPDWLHFFQVSILDQQGAPAEMTPYGRELMKPERKQPLPDIVLAPGDAIEADIPVGSIYQLRKGRYDVQISCEASGGRVVSNEVVIEV